MPSILNVSRDNFNNGRYKFPRNGAIAIRITDPAWELKPMRDVMYDKNGIAKGFTEFSDVFDYEFLDADPITQPDLKEFCFTIEQAEEIYQILVNALKSDTDIVVHCTAGLCRSGAIVEAAVMLGFTDPFVVRQPNAHVKSLLVRQMYDLEN